MEKAARTKQELLKELEEKNRLIAELQAEKTERRAKQEKQLRQSERELKIRNQIAEIFLTVPDADMYGDVLQIILEVMDSKYGVFGYIDETGNLVVPTMTRTVWDQCQVPEKTIVFPRETWGDSTWSRAIREKRTIWMNETSAKTPEGHISISRHISLPIIHQQEVIGLIQVANKETDYEEEDLRLLETIGNAIAPVLDARLQRERQEKARQQAERELQQHRDHLEEVVQARTAELEKANGQLQQEIAEGKRREEVIRQQTEEILELSTPVIQVWEGVVVAPLIGTLDSQRTQRFMEVLLERIVATNSPMALVDITGVPTIDTLTAQNLIETVAAVRLLGAQVILTGVRPAIAQTLVHLGIDLAGVETRTSLAAGLKLALAILGQADGPNRRENDRRM